MGFLGVNPAQLCIDGPDTNDEKANRDIYRQHEASDQKCHDCGEPLYWQVDLVGSRNLILPIVHRCWGSP